MAIIQSLKRYVPLRVLAIKNYYLYPGLRHPYGGPFNNQDIRRRIFEQLLLKIPFKNIIETGAFTGSTTELFAQTQLPVNTVESQEMSFEFARFRLRTCRNVSVHRGDSRTFLRDLSKKPDIVSHACFFYLDAHFYEDLPLLDELEIIFDYWKLAVVMIDDFQVPFDPDYGFDDYGPGKTLNVDYIRPMAASCGIFFPSAPAIQETGYKRGSVVLTTANFIPEAESIPLLKRFTL